MSNSKAIEITEDFILYADGTVQTPPKGCKYDVSVIERIIKAGLNPGEKEDEQK